MRKSEEGKHQTWGQSKGFHPARPEAATRSAAKSSHTKHLHWSVRSRDWCTALHLFPSTHPAWGRHMLDWGDRRRQERLDFWCGFGVLCLPSIIWTLNRFFLLILHCSKGKIYASEFKAHILPCRLLPTAHLTKGQTSSNMILCLLWWMLPLSLE